MNRIIAIFKREFASYYISPVAYAVYTIFLVLSGYFFYSLTAYYTMVSIQYSQMPYGMGPLNFTEGITRPLFHNMSIIMLLTLPLLTMRMFSEEKKMGTIELLFTYPVTELEVVAGKLLAACCVFGVMLLLTFPFPVMLFLYAQPDPGPVVTGYAGLLLMGVSFLALGMFTSVLTENQIIAAVTSFGSLLMFWIVGWGTTFTGGLVAKFFTQVSMIEHFDNFTKGLVAGADLTYYVLFTAFFTYLTLKFLETRKWRS